MGETIQTLPQEAMHESLFLSGSLALDLVNTEIIVRDKKRDMLSSTAALARWWDEACEQHPDDCHFVVLEKPINWNTNLLLEVKMLRTVLRTLYTCLIEQQSLDEDTFEYLNRILALGYPALHKTTAQSVKPVIRLRDPQQGAIILPIALSALHLFTTKDQQRLHVCKNERCILFFYDTTRSGTRQWCSLSCMHRSRSFHNYHKNNVATHA
ncbi:RNA-binding protein [Dictyobacter alpinus]|uniref:RNA-binding protein n=2 Tax=Dictyobacter alpinus TaxID=2014873 RepID=A0A402BJZ8_9CHLR|nr:RNA-binding protein [Dictyobacter alpinus]